MKFNAVGHLLLLSWTTLNKVRDSPLAFHSNRFFFPLSGFYDVLKECIPGIAQHQTHETLAAAKLSSHWTTETSAPQESLAQTLHVIWGG